MTTVIILLFYMNHAYRTNLIFSGNRQGATEKEEQAPGDPENETEEANRAVEDESINREEQPHEKALAEGGNHSAEGEVSPEQSKMHEDKEEQQTTEEKESSKVSELEQHKDHGRVHEESDRNYDSSDTSDKVPEEEELGGTEEQFSAPDPEPVPVSSRPEESVLDPEPVSVASKPEESVPDPEPAPVAGKPEESDPVPVPVASKPEESVPDPEPAPVASKPEESVTEPVSVARKPEESEVLPGTTEPECESSRAPEDKGLPAIPPLIPSIPSTASSRPEESSQSGYSGRRDDNRDDYRVSSRWHNCTRNS